MKGCTHVFWHKSQLNKRIKSYSATLLNLKHKKFKNIFLQRHQNKRLENKMYFWLVWWSWWWRIGNSWSFILKAWMKVSSIFTAGSLLSIRPQSRWDCSLIWWVLRIFSKFSKSKRLIWNKKEIYSVKYKSQY